jgi:antitoxin (DNA-binding transcriptional repressor) of toxin-antitoxin stability system
MVRERLVWCSGHPKATNQTGKQLSDTPGRPQVDLVATRGYVVGMRSVGIKEMKNRLSYYVRLAAEGEPVLVTDRDRVVAELGPPRPGRAPVLNDAALADLVRRGVLTPALRGPGSAVPESLAPIGSLEDVLEGLAKDREERT